MLAGIVWELVSFSLFAGMIWVMVCLHRRLALIVLESITGALLDFAKLQRSPSAE